MIGRTLREQMMNPTWLETVSLLSDANTANEIYFAIAFRLIWFCSFAGDGAAASADVVVVVAEWNSIIVDQFQIANIYIQLVMPCGNKTRAINLSNSKTSERARERASERAKCGRVYTFKRRWANENAIYRWKYHLIHIRCV